VRIARSITELLSAHGGKDPMKGNNSKDFSFRSLSVPPASRAFARDVVVPENLHSLVLRERRHDALPFQVDVVAAFGTYKNESVGFIHNFRITLRSVTTDSI